MSISSSSSSAAATSALPAATTGGAPSGGGGGGAQPVMPNPNQLGTLDNAQALLSDERFAGAKQVFDDAWQRAQSADAGAAAPTTAEAAEAGGGGGDVDAVDATGGARPNVVLFGFAKLVYDFLLALHERFPDAPLIAKSVQHYWPVVQTMPQEPYEHFAKLSAACGNAVFEERTAANEQRVLSELLKVSFFFKMAHIERVWCPELDEPTKDTIWEHVRRLVHVANLIRSFDGDMCGIIDQIASDAVGDIGDVSNLDMTQLLEMVQGRLMTDETLMDKIVDFVARRKGGGGGGGAAGVF